MTILMVERWKVLGTRMRTMTIHGDQEVEEEKHPALQPTLIS